MRPEVPVHDPIWLLTSGQFIMKEAGVRKVAHPETVIKQRGDWDQVPNILIKGILDDLMTSEKPYLPSATRANDHACSMHVFFCGGRGWLRYKLKQIENTQLRKVNSDNIFPTQVWISLGPCISLWVGKSPFVLFPSAGTDINVFTGNVMFCLVNNFLNSLAPNSVLPNSFRESVT